jgi:hypothetical protein
LFLLASLLLGGVCATINYWQNRKVPPRDQGKPTNSNEEQFPLIQSNFM